MKNLTRNFYRNAVFALLLGLGCIGFANAQNVTICHKGNTITVSQSAVNAHLNHGDVLGSCAGDCIDPNLIDPDRICIALYNPVCGCDGNTYSNSCVATYGYGVTSYTPGPCNNPCIGTPLPIFCPTYVDPVCGCNGVTYSNACFAAAAGVLSSTPGACGSGFKRIDSPADAHIQPNPTTGLATISWTAATEQATTVYVLDMMGKTVHASQPITVTKGSLHSYQLDATELPAGVYLVQVRSGDVSTSQKLVVQH